MNAKVAIYQNTLTGGGRIRVVNEIIRLLNQLGIVPDVFSLRVSRTFMKEAGLRFRLVKLPAYVLGLYEVKIIALNRMMCRYAAHYNLFINSNNCLVAAPKKVATIAYVHFPREARIASKYMNLAFPDGRRVDQANPLYKSYRVFLDMLRRRSVLGANIKIVSNSQFSKDRLLEVYPQLPPSSIPVIYPPVTYSTIAQQESERRNVVCTLGRFSPDKRQMEQIEIARTLPDVQFEIMGFVGDRASRRYHSRCQQFVSNQRIKNVTLLPNLTSQQVAERLATARFCMHNLRNEPFGISTAEAIGVGCIPLVHDSGGQREIVEPDALRFRDLHDATSKLKFLMSQKSPNYLTRLQTNLSKFCVAAFEAGFGRLLRESIENGQSGQ